MSQFEDLIREWDDMMSMEFDAASLDEHGISFVQEQRILDLTAQYICKLEGIQKDSDTRGADFADRLLQTAQVEDRYRAQVREICQRFLSSVGMIFRDEIPRDLPRTRRLGARQFIINWRNGIFVGKWPELGIEFPLRDSLVYCAEHIAGAEEKLGDTIVSLFLSELTKGTVQIPRMALVAKEASSLVFQWKDASVSLGDPIPTPSADFLQLHSSPILAYFRERLEESQRRLEQALMSKPEPENPNVLALRVIDEIELAGSDPIHEKVSAWLSNVGKYSGVSQADLVQKFEEVAYAEASEAIVLDMPKAIEKRVKVIKSLNSIHRKQRRELVSN
jgi:hypothetical protein